MSSWKLSQLSNRLGLATHDAIGGAVAFRLGLLLCHVLTVFCIAIPRRIWTMVDSGFCVHPHLYKWVAGTGTCFAGTRSGVAGINIYNRLARTRIYVWRGRIVCRRFPVECFRRDESTDQYKSGE